MKCMETIWFLLLMFTVASSIKPSEPPTYSITDYGAVGNGVADDTQAFIKAWDLACGSRQNPRVIVPKGKSFLFMQTTFVGPCKSKRINFQIDGVIVAPDDPKLWKGLDASLWIQFKHVNGLTISGQGKVDGRGYNWWKQSCKVRQVSGCTRQAPSIIKFIKCNDLQVSGVSVVNSPQTHLIILGCQSVWVHNINVQAPATSPNTDGIHIQSSQHVRIQDSKIGSGDDCISVGDSVYDIIINHVSCGPGHGISVGSLGKGGTQASVQDVHVSNVDFHGTTNGARIKTWQGATGFARGITFEHCTFDNVQNPIMIDQYYCDLAGCRPQPKAVKISNVTYSDFRGTSNTLYAVTVKCSQSIPCTDIQFDTLNLTLATSKADPKVYCINAFGKTKGFIHPPLSCLH